MVDFPGPSSDSFEHPLLPHDVWMRQALAEARAAFDEGEVPVGAVVVHAGRVIAAAHNQREALNDPTAHAEMQALRDAQRRLGRNDLSGAVLYGTSRACPMCEAGAARARVARMLHGESLQDAGAPRGS